MTMGSLFSGIGGFELAGAIHGVKTLWASEIEEYPIKVTQANFPHIVHVGDIQKLDGATLEKVDIITSGSPCTDISRAGRREGIDGERSALFFDYIRIIKEMRDATNCHYPRISIWENVPAALSSNGGNDFRRVLQCFAEINGYTADIPIPKGNKWAKAGAIVGDGWSVAWRLFDAQHWGVAQRRRRLYLIADFGGERAGEVLFEREGRFWHPSASREEGESVAVHPEAGADGDGKRGAPVSIEQTLFFPIDGHQHDGRFKLCQDGVMPTIPAYMGTGGNNGPMVLKIKAYALQRFGEYKLSDVASTLKARDYKDATDLIVTRRENKYRVRRLMPVECLRLQGFPDTWLDGVKGSNSAKFKAIGNAVAIPNAAYMMQCAVKLMTVSAHD